MTFAKIFCFGNMPKTCKPFAGLWRYICVARKVLVYQFLIKEITMKQLITLIATIATVSAFAAEPAKKEEKKADAKPAVTAPAPAAPAPATPAKSEPAKKDAAKADAKAAAPASK